MSEIQNPNSISLDISQQLANVTQQLTDLTERVTDLETKLLLIPDIERYSKLQTFLMAGQFKEADLETTNIILETVATDRNDLTPEAMTKFPCNVLFVIDRLWRIHSQDRFGFSVQLEIYQKSGGSLDTLRTQDRKIMGIFATQVGWLVEGQLRFDAYDEWDFSLNAPRGGFPAIWWRSPYGLKMVTFFFTRLFECAI